MYAPAQHSEIEGYRNYLDQQLAAIRAALVGLTEEQAAATPCRSTLSVVGIVKHCSYGMRGATERLRAGTVPAAWDGSAIQTYLASFALGDGETAAGVLAEFDRTRSEFLAAVEGVDPEAAATEAPAPWAGINQALPIRQRFYLVHLIEEFARHAGHADIVREQLDGVSVPQIVLSQEGAPANEFFQPYVPNTGTVGS